jgi:hypothetical protein
MLSLKTSDVNKCKHSKFIISYHVMATYLLKWYNSSHWLIFLLWVEFIDPFVSKDNSSVGTLIVLIYLIYNETH